MVKKYFRPFIKAICLSFSLIYCAGNMAAAFVSAENMTEVLAETEENQLEETEQAEPVIQSDKVESEEQSEDVVEETEKKVESDPAVESEEIKKEEVRSPENEKVEETEPEKQEETFTEENPTEETTKEEIEEKAEFHVSEIKMEKEEYSVGDDAFIFLNGIQAKNLGMLEIRVNGPAYKGYSISGEGMQYRAKEVSDSEHTEYTVTMDAVNDTFTNEKNIQIKVPVEKYQKNLHFKVTVTAYDKAGMVLSLEERILEAAVKKDVHAVNVSYTQTPEKPSRADEIRQNVKIIYQDPVTSKIEYKLDSAVKVNRIEIGSNTYLEGGKATIQFADGEAEIPVTAVMDLSSYVGVRKIIFLPKVAAYANMEAAFTAVLALEQNVDSYTGTVTVITGTGEEAQTVDSSLTSEVLKCVVDKPFVSHEKKIISFGDEFEIKIRNLGMNSYGLSKNFESELLIPDFVEVKELHLPEMMGTEQIQVFLVTGEEQKTLGTYTPGETVPVQASGIHAVIMKAEVPEYILTTENEGSVIMVNNSEKNKSNYFGFRMTNKVLQGETEYTESSQINGVTFEIYKPTEVKPEPTPVPNPPAPIEPVDPVEPEPEVTPTPEPTQGPSEEERAEEERLKEEARKEALRKEKELREKQKALLAARVEAIHAESLEVEGSASAQKESIRKDLNRFGMRPISEKIIESTVLEKLEPIATEVVEI